MATLRELKGRINSVASTEKTTSAMKMISSAKMHKATGQLQRLKPYRAMVKDVLSHLLITDVEFSSPLIEQREVNSIAVVLYGSDGYVKRFSSAAPAVIDPAETDGGLGGSLPVATVQVSSPMALAASLSPVTTPAIVPFVPESVSAFIGGELVAPVAQQVATTVGIFSITTLSREVQLTLPSYDFCMPRGECGERSEDPCEAFNKIEFPSESFFPRGAQEGDGGNPFDCHCGS